MRLYNSLTRQVEEIQPVDGTTVRMYSCGPTVYRYAHIGNMRSFVLGDLVRRGLRFEGTEVQWVMNITDVGHMTDDASVDKMDLAVADEGLSAWEIADKYTKAFLEDADAVGIERADSYPKATDHIPEMLELTRQLIERGHAYEVEGSVYYDVHTFPEYGKLSGNTLDKLRSGSRQDLEIDANKRHPEDFALWKRADPNRLMQWDSPWGSGFPGWHIECSAMSMKYLGERFDLHTGGQDLKFPHHEDEIAQSDGATGHQVITAWAHGGFLQLSGQKMAKSTGNIARVTELAEQGYDPLAFRLLCFGTRYRSEMDFSNEAMDVADRTLTRIRQRMEEWKEAPREDGLGPEAKDLDEKLRRRVAEDLDMPGAVVVLNETISAEVPDGDKYALLSSWDAVLGLDLERLAHRDLEIPSDVQALVRERDEARRAKDFARSDEIRDRLTQMGWEVMDTDAGTRVRPLAGR
ncbi:MAG: cysteine--tRNA ligase [Actinomycetota bacterium]